MNPPFSRMAEVVRKIRQDRARCVLIAPNWKSLEWFDEVQPWVRKRYYLKQGERLFEDEKGPVGPTPWGVWAFLVDAGLEPVKRRVVDMEGEKYVENTQAKKRRRRRRWREEVVA